MWCGSWSFPIINTPQVVIEFADYSCNCVLCTAESTALVHLEKFHNALSLNHLLSSSSIFLFLHQHSPSSTLHLIPSFSFSHVVTFLSSRPLSAILRVTRSSFSWSLRFMDCLPALGPDIWLHNGTRSIHYASGREGSMQGYANIGESATKRNTLIKIPNEILL